MQENGRLRAAEQRLAVAEVAQSGHGDHAAGHARW
jgi:hypothetical protein